MKWSFPKRLLPRFILILGGPMICVQLILAYLFIERHTHSILTLLAQTLAGDVRVIVDLLESGTPLKEIKATSKNLNLNVDISKTLIVPKYGVHKNTWLYRFLKRAFEFKLQRTYFLRMRKKTIHVMVPTHLGMFVITTPSQRFFNKTIPYVFFGTVISSFVLLLIAFLFMRVQIRSIIRLTEAVEQLGRGENATDFKPEGALEVKQAGHAFLTMKNRVQRHLKQRLDMLSGISHDLRTPLTRMKLQLACMPSSANIKGLDHDVNQMHQMIEAFLNYARGNTEEGLEKINIQTMIEESVECVRPFPVTVICPNHFFLFVKPLILKRCLINVLLNSKRVAKSSVISVIEQSRFIKIIIDDDGPGIPLSERKNVFRPFYRLNLSRNLDNGGVGLGLCIVQDGIQSHGGRVALESAPFEQGGGLRVIFWLPKFYQ